MNPKIKTGKQLKVGDVITGQTLHRGKSLQIIKIENSVVKPWKVLTFNDNSSCVVAGGEKYLIIEEFPLP